MDKEDKVVRFEAQDLIEKYSGPIGGIEKTEEESALFSMFIEKMLEPKKESKCNP